MAQQKNGLALKYRALASGQLEMHVLSVVSLSSLILLKM
jgi:hypothetical protein